MHQLLLVLMDLFSLVYVAFQFIKIRSCTLNLFFKKVGTQVMLNEFKSLLKFFLFFIVIAITVDYRLLDHERSLVRDIKLLLLLLL